MTALRGLLLLGGPAAELWRSGSVEFDNCDARPRNGVAPQVMAALRNSVMHVLSDVVAPGLASAMRHTGNCLSQALALLGLPQLE
jgi:hypothetical protein